jgi:hypothetical protein
MKKLFIVVLLLGVSISSKAQELFASATNKSVDGYLTAGYIKNGWGVYAGVPYNDNNIVNYRNGSLSDNMKFGIIKSLTPDKWILGTGIQPTIDGRKINAFLGFNPLKSKDMKLWMIGNIVGDEFSAGLGLSYRLK